jgi:peptidoglycan/xylan/chitin deacetylase (PgdA/CDA1 family)
MAMQASRIAEHWKPEGQADMTTIEEQHALQAVHVGERGDGRFAPEKAVWKRSLNDLGMRAVGWMAVGLNEMLGSRAGEPAGILMYHRVAPHAPGLPRPLHNVAPERFREQLTGLLRRGYSFRSLRELLALHHLGAPVSPKTVAITFDDGFQTVYTRAFPVLKELEAPATVFVNTAYLDSDAPFPFDAWGVACRRRAPDEAYLPLTTRQCREMVATGLVEIGAHTHTHADFRGRPEEFQHDLQLSVDIIRRLFDPPLVTFAFPYGGTHDGFAGDELAHAARATGVACGLTTECALVDPQSDPFRWGRFNAFPWDTSRTLAAKLSDWYSWAPRLRKRLGRKLRATRPTVAGVAP